MYIWVLVEGACFAARISKEGSIAVRGKEDLHIQSFATVFLLLLLLLLFYYFYT